MTRGRNLAGFSSAVSGEFSDINITGIVTAASFVGDGSQLTNVGGGAVGPNDSINTTGIITASSFSGSGSGLTGLGTFSGNYSDLSGTPTIPTNNNQLTNGAGFITTSFTNTNQLTNGAGFITTSFTDTNQLANGAGFITNNTSGTVTATAFVGDGSGLTSVIGSGSGVVIKDGGSSVGTAGTIDFGANLSVSPISVGVVTITAAAGSGSTVNVSTNSLVVSGISTLGIVTGVTSVEATDFYGKLHGNGGTITGINANNITSGTLPNNRFPATLPAVDGSQLTGIGTFSRDYNDLSNKPTIPANTSDLTNDSGFITNQVVGIITALAFRGSGAELVDGKWTLGADGSNHYTFTGVGFTQTTNDPDLYLQRGRTYQFVNPLNAHPFQIQDTANGNVGNPYNNGVTNNGSQLGTIEIEVPFNAPDTLYYQCTAHPAMGGPLYIFPLSR